MNDKREALVQDLYEKAQMEHSRFLESFDEKSHSEIIQSAYQISTMDDLLMSLEEPDFLTVPQLTYLAELSTPLSILYDHWLKIEDSSMEELRNCIEYYTEDHLVELAVKQTENPQTPRYDKTYTIARELGETAQYNASRKRDAICLQTFKDKVYDAYEGRAIAQFVEDWTSEFGKERCRFVLGYSVHAADYDGRYSKQSKRVANEIDYSELDCDSYRSSGYRTNVHPCIINVAFECLIEGKQKSKNMER